jgi:hypothetical protein
MDRIECDLTEEDMLSFNLFFLQHSPGAARRRRRLRFGVPIFYAVLAVVLFYIGRTGAATVFLAIAVLWAALYPLWVGRYQRRYLVEQIAETMGDQLPCPTVYELREGGIFANSLLGESTFRYDVVDRVEEDGSRTYVFVGKAMGLVLPHDRVPRADIDAFVETVLQRRDEARRVRTP